MTSLQTAWISLFLILLLAHEMEGRGGRRGGKGKGKSNLQFAQVYCSRDTEILFDIPDRGVLTDSATTGRQQSRKTRIVSQAEILSECSHHHWVSLLPNVQVRKRPEGE